MEHCPLPYWSPGGPPEIEWRLSLADALPALTGLSAKASTQHRADAFAALDCIVQIVITNLRNGPRISLIEKIPAKWLNNGLADAFYLNLCERIGKLDHNRGPFYDVYDRKVVDRDYVRYSDTNLSLGFHTDSTSAANPPDVVGLLCVRQAHRGGASRLVNLYNVYTRLATENPEVLTFLRENFPRQTRSVATGQVDPSSVAFYPILTGNIAEGNLSCRYIRRWIDAGYVSAGIAQPAGVASLLEAFDWALETDPAMLSFRMAPGEILLLDNQVILHDRESYQDLAHARRLMRRAWIFGGPE